MFGGSIDVVGGVSGGHGDGDFFNFTHIRGGIQRHFRHYVLQRGIDRGVIEADGLFHTAGKGYAPFLVQYVVQITGVILRRIVRPEKEYVGFLRFQIDVAGIFAAIAFFQGDEQGIPLEVLAVIVAHLRKTVSQVVVIVRADNARLHTIVNGDREGDGHEAVWPHVRHHFVLAAGCQQRLPVPRKCFV